MSSLDDIDSLTPRCFAALLKTIDMCVDLFSDECSEADPKNVPRSFVDRLPRGRSAEDACNLLRELSAALKDQNGTLCKRLDILREILEKDYSEAMIATFRQQVHAYFPDGINIERLSYKATTWAGRTPIGADERLHYCVELVHHLFLSVARLSDGDLFAPLEELACHLGSQDTEPSPWATVMESLGLFPKELTTLVCWLLEAIPEDQRRYGL